MGSPPGGGTGAGDSEPGGGGGGTGPGGGLVIVVGGPIGIVIPGATSILGWITVSVGGGVVDEGGGGGGGAGTPAYPPTSAGLGNDSMSVPFRAPSIVAFQMSEGMPEP